MKPRQWIIPGGVGGFYDNKEVNYAVGPILNIGENIIVIEKSAYDELLKDYRELYIATKKDD